MDKKLDELYQELLKPENIGKTKIKEALRKEFDEYIFGSTESEIILSKEEINEAVDEFLFIVKVMTVSYTHLDVYKRQA